MSNMYRRTKNDPRLTKKRAPFFAGLARRIKDFFGYRSTDPWKVTLSKKRIQWARIVAPVLIVTIPLSVIMIVDNVLMRLPDIYKYHFLSSEILGERMIAAEEDDVAQLISDFLFHSTDRFMMKENLEYMPAEVFAPSDGAMMQELRSMLDLQLGIGIFMVLVTIAIIAFVVHKKEKDLLLQCFYYSLPAFVLLKLADTGLMMFGPLRNRVFGIPTVDPASESDLIPALLDDSFFGFLALVEAGLCLVVLGILYYIILNLSGRKSTFRR